MKMEMLINAVHPEQKRMAIVSGGKLVDYNIQMAVKEPITGNLYKGVVTRVERGLQAAFVRYGGRKEGFLPLRDVNPAYFTERKETEEGGATRGALKSGQEVLVQVLREVGERKGALLTTYISLPGRYMVLLPNRSGGGISRKIEDEEDRKRLKAVMDQIKEEAGMGFIVRTAGMNRTKQELTRDYQHLIRLWREIEKKTAATKGPSLIYQESDFGIKSLRDYFTSEVSEVWVDDPETFKMMRAYCKTVSPRSLAMIKQYKEKTPIFERFGLEEQIRVIYQEKVDLKSGGYLIINPTEAMITIDVNSGRGSNKRNVEETAFRTNMEAADEIARQLRLRDLGGLIVIDFIDMETRQHNAEVEKAFKNALSVDRARIQLSKISKFGMLELSRQKKQSTIQEISYTTCPFCKGTGIRPSLEYTALSAFRKIESQAVRDRFSQLKVLVPAAIAEYLLNNKRSELLRLEQVNDMTVYIHGNPDMQWDEIRIETRERETPREIAAELAEDKSEEASVDTSEVAAGNGEAADGTGTGKKKRRRRRRRRKPGAEAEGQMVADDSADADTDLPAEDEAAAAETEEASSDSESPSKKKPRRRRRRGKKSGDTRTATPEGETPAAEAVETVPEAAPAPKTPRRRRKTGTEAIIEPMAVAPVVEETAKKPKRRSRGKTAVAPEMPPEEKAEEKADEKPPARRSRGRKVKADIPPESNGKSAEATEANANEASAKPARRRPRHRRKKPAEGADAEA